MDENLNWSKHISTVKTKIGIICKARCVLKSSTLVTLYNSFVFPYMSYCIEVWGGASDKYMSSLFKLQKRAVRVITSSAYLAHTSPIFFKLNILNIYKVYALKIIMLMYKYEHRLLPSSVQDMFVTNNFIHQHFTRQSHKIHVPKGRTNLIKRSFRHYSVVLWNCISDILDYNCTISSFKYRLKKYLLISDVPI